MSNLPLKSSNLHNHQRNRGYEFVRLSKNFLLLPDSKSQLACILNTITQEFSCNLFIWLSETFIKDFNLSQPACDDLALINFSGIVAEAFQRQAVTPVPDFDARFDDLPRVIALPLVINDEVLAVLQLEREVREGFTFDEVNSISEVGLQSAILLDWQRQRLISSKVQNKIQFLNQILNISKSISSILDLENLLNSVTSLIHQSFYYHRVSIFTPYDIGKKKLNRVSVSQNGYDVGQTDYFTDDGTPVGWVMAHGQPVIVNDTRSERRFPQAVFDAHTQSELIIPLASTGQLLGVLDICSDLVDSFGEIEETAFQTLGETAAVTIRNIKILRSEKSHQQVSDNLKRSLPASQTILHRKHLFVFCTISKEYRLMHLDYG
jgi:GAF domain-containing protein